MPAAIVDVSTQCGMCRRWLLEHDYTCPNFDPGDDRFNGDADHYRFGAAVAFGLMGMAEAIRYGMGYRSCLFTTSVRRPISFDDEPEQATGHCDFHD